MQLGLRFLRIGCAIHLELLANPYLVGEILAEFTGAKTANAIAVLQQCGIITRHFRPTWPF
jgi:hypothetical protein